MIRKPLLGMAVALLVVGLVAVLEGSALSPQRSPEPQPLLQPQPQILEIGGGNASAVKSAGFCEVNLTGPPAYYITGWTFFDTERYAAYQDAAACGYPFGVTDASFDLYATAACSAIVYVQLLRVISSDSGCVMPGAPFFTSGIDTVIFPHSGLFELSFPLSDTVCIYSPYYVALVFVGDAACLNPVIDNTPTTCLSFYNYTDDLWADLVQVYGFPGDLVMHTGGLTADQNGCPAYPPPNTIITRPSDTAYWNDHPYFKDTLCVQVIDYMQQSKVAYTTFEYFDNLLFFWETFYTDDDGTEAGLDWFGPSPPPGDGWSGYWVPTGIQEGYYMVRATMTDSLGRSISDTIITYYDPNPPVPTITTPSIFSSKVVLPTDIVFSTNANKVQEMVITKFPAGGPRPGCEKGFDKGIDTLDQHEAYPHPGIDGKNRGCYPTAIGACLKWWAKHGFPGLDDFGQMSEQELVEELARRMNTDPNDGTLHGNARQGAQEYIDSKLGKCKFKVELLGGAVIPLHRLIKELLVNNEDVIVTDWHHAVTANSICFWPTFYLDFMDPWTGRIVIGPDTEHGFDGDPITHMLVISPKKDDDSPKPDTLGRARHQGGQEYLYTLTDSSCSLYVANSAYLVEAVIIDSTGHVGSDMVNLEFVARGDANGDGTINIGDAVYIVNYIFKSGPPPNPFDAGDANCDHAVNVGDAINIINYIFKGGPKPCCY